MWTRALVKQHGLENFKRNYLKTVIVTILLMLCLGSSISFANISELRQVVSQGGSFFSGNGQDMGRQMEGVFGVEGFGDFEKNFEKEFGLLPGFENIDGTNIVAAFIIAFILIMLIVFVVSEAITLFLLNPLSIGCYRFLLDNHNTKADMKRLGHGFSVNYGRTVFTMFLRDLYQFLWYLLSLVFVFIISIGVSFIVFTVNPAIMDKNSMMGFLILFMITLPLAMLGLIPFFIKKNYSYRLVPYIVADNPDINGTEAISLSRKLMNGNKWKTFVLDLSFIGWYLLSGLATLTITAVLFGANLFFLNILTGAWLAILFVNPYKVSTDAELYLCIRYNIAGGQPAGGSNGPSEKNTVVNNTPEGVAVPVVPPVDAGSEQTNNGALNLDLNLDSTAVPKQQAPETLASTGEIVKPEEEVTADSGEPGAKAEEASETDNSGQEASTAEAMASDEIKTEVPATEETMNTYTSPAETVSENNTEPVVTEKETGAAYIAPAAEEKPGETAFGMIKEPDETENDDSVIETVSSDDEGIVENVLDASSENKDNKHDNTYTGSVL
ncbi:MAG: DUF975 family protein [Lachnospiraceae bacterium]|nr:DUF975 family protein [Lachnospiraceae bacterium]